jgi:hypothetical protein
MSFDLTPVQTRSEENGLEYHPDLPTALAAAKADPTIWKISFAGPGMRVRLVKREIPLACGKHAEEAWVFESMEDAVQEALAKAGPR